ncbi:MAG: hypothetical protein PHD25_03915 [Bacteroidales bacterium]|nr:hypothetical protein [Bacteroidales bacterium]
MKQVFALLFIPFLIIPFSCNTKDDLCQWVTFNNQAWNRFEKQKFGLSVMNTTASFDMKLILRHNDDYPFDNLYIHIVMEMPGGEERIMEKDFRIRDALGNFLSGDRNGYRELSFYLFKDLNFSEKGLCSVEIENLIPKIEIPGILELGLCLQKSGRDQGKKR